MHLLCNTCLVKYVLPFRADILDLWMMWDEWEKIKSILRSYDHSEIHNSDCALYEITYIKVRCLHFMGDPVTKDIILYDIMTSNYLYWLMLFLITCMCDTWSSWAEHGWSTLVEHASSWNLNNSGKTRSTHTLKGGGKWRTPIAKRRKKKPLTMVAISTDQCTARGESACPRSDKTVLNNMR